MKDEVQNLAPATIVVPEKLINSLLERVDGLLESLAAYEATLKHLLREQTAVSNG